MQQTVLILGANGGAGSHAATAFWNAGWTVRRYQRGTDMIAAAQGADVIVNALNYHNWAKLIPEITSQVIAAAKASGATVIIPGNIYNYGDQPGVLGADTPQRPNTRKGQIRVEMEQAYRDAGVKTIILRAGNFIDPDGNGDLMQLMFLRSIKSGKLAAPSDPDVMQAYAYMPDWARAACLLAEMRADLPQFADVPFPGHSFTVTQLRDVIATRLDRPIKITYFPWWIMRALAPFWELAREMREMRYLFDMSHEIDGRTFSKLLQKFEPTDLHQVMTCGLPADIDPDKMMRSGGQTIPAE